MEGGQTLLAIVFWIVLFVAHWSPAIIAFNKGHHNKWPIFWVNFFLGWTLLGWVVALVWALSKPPEVRVVEIEKK